MQKLAFFRSREGLLHVWALVGGLYIRMKKMEMQLEFWIVGVGLGPLLHIWKVVYLLFTPENLGKPSQNTHTQRRERNDANQRFTWIESHFTLGHIPMVLGQVLLHASDWRGPLSQTQTYWVICHLRLSLLRLITLPILRQSAFIAILADNWKPFVHDNK